MKCKAQRLQRFVVTVASVAVAVFFAVVNSNAADPVVLTPDSSYLPTGAPHLPSGAAPPRGTPRTASPVAAQHILVKIGADVDQAAILEQAQGLGLSKRKRLASTNWYMMSLPQRGGTTAREMAAAARQLAGVTAAVADPLLQIADTIPPTDPYYSDDPDPGTDCDLIEDPDCNEDDLVDQWGLFQVEAESAWSVQTGSPEVIIAVLDSGIDLDHDDLWANIWTNDAEMAGIDGVDDDGNGKIDDKRGYDFAGNNVGSPSDDPASEDANPDIFSVPAHQWIADSTAVPFGYRFDGDAAVGDGIDNNLEYYPLFFTMDIGVTHGTAVAGVIGMMANNINPETTAGEGMVGACWHCKIMNVRTINAEGEALGSDMVEAIYYAVDNGAHIINASWGIAPGAATAQELQPLEEAIRYAVEQGVVFIAASGNGGGAGLYFPASMPETIAVGSSNWLDARSDFSTYALGGEVLDVVAPGELIWTSGVMSAYDAWSANYWLLFPELWYEPWRPGADTYSVGDGTSFATPLVSGYAGLILSHNPCATAEDVRQILRTEAIDVGANGYDAQTGYGRMRMVVPDLGCGTQDALPSVTVTTPVEGATVVGEITITATASDDHGVETVEFFVDGASIGTDVVAEDGWSVLWDSRTATDGNHTITATARDSAAQTATDVVSVTVDNVNDLPSASFTYSCTHLACTFDASASSDPDGTVSGYTWHFGDGTSGAGVGPSHEYTAANSYAVTLFVTDNDNDASNPVMQTVTVTAAPSAPPTVTNFSATDGTDGTATVTWSISADYTGAVQVERESWHAKRSRWRGTTTVWDGTGTGTTEMSIIDASGTGLFRYRVGDAGGGLIWSDWAEVDVTNVSGGGGGGGGGKGRKPR